MATRTQVFPYSWEPDHPCLWQLLAAKILRVAAQVLAKRQLDIA